MLRVINYDLRKLVFRPKIMVQHAIGDPVHHCRLNAVKIQLELDLNAVNMEACLGRCGQASFDSHQGHESESSLLKKKKISLKFR